MKLKERFLAFRNKEKVLLSVSKQFSENFELLVAFNKILKGIKITDHAVFNGLELDLKCIGIEGQMNFWTESGDLILAKFNEDFAEYNNNTALSNYEKFIYEEKLAYYAKKCFTYNLAINIVEQISLLDRFVLFITGSPVKIKLKSFHTYIKGESFEKDFELNCQVKFKYFEYCSFNLINSELRVYSQK